MRRLTAGAVCLVSTTSTSRCNGNLRPICAPIKDRGSDREIFRLGMVDDDRRGRLLGVELVFLGQRDADLVGAQQVEQLPLVGEVGTGRVAERIAAAAIALLPASPRCRAPPRRQSPTRRGSAGAGIRPGPRPSRPTARADRGNPDSGSRRTTRARHRRRAGPSSRPAARSHRARRRSTSRKKSAMQSPPSLFWRGNEKRAISRRRPRSNRITSLPSRGARPIAISRLRHQDFLADRDVEHPRQDRAQFVLRPFAVFVQRLAVLAIAPLELVEHALVEIRHAPPLATPA